MALPNIETLLAWLPESGYSIPGFLHKTRIMQRLSGYTAYIARSAVIQEFASGAVAAFRIEQSAAVARVIPRLVVTD